MYNVSELESMIKHHAQLYYSGSPEIEDYEFDNLVEELRKLDSGNKLLSTVGWGYDPSASFLEKVIHPLGTVGGVDHKVRVEKSDTITMDRFMGKFDGASVDLNYVNGELFLAVSRGDGYIGLDVTNKLRNLVPNHIDMFEGLSVSIAGEYILSNENYKKYYSDRPNPRNVATGFLSKQDYTTEEEMRFDYLPYRINYIKRLDLSKGISKLEERLYNAYNSRTLCDEVNSILIESFYIVPHRYVNDSGLQYSNMYEVCTSNLGIAGDSLTYQCDGVVAGDSKFSYTIENISPGFIKICYDETAFKTDNEEKVVEVTDITFRLTRTGRVVPRVWFNPVQLSGASVKKATAHNCQYLVDNNIGIGSKVKIIRSGEVIPYIKSVIEPTECKLPDKCSACGSEYVWNGVDLVCSNPNCSAKDEEFIYRWVSYMGSVDGAGPSLYSAIIEFFDIKDINDIYEINNPKDILGYEGIGTAKAELVEKIITQMQTQNIKFSEFLVGLNIKGLSHKTAKKVSSESSLLQSIVNHPNDKYFEGLSGVMYQTIIDNWDFIVSNYNKVKSQVSEDSAIFDGTLNEDKIKVTITGSLEFGTRSKFVENYSDKIEEVSINNAQYLITNNSDSTSSKCKKAKALGIQIISESDFIKMIGE